MLANICQIGFPILVHQGQTIPPERPTASGEKYSMQHIAI